MLANPREKLDCFTRVITPENIEFEYMLAGPFQRLPAFLFDFAVRLLAIIASVLLLATVAAGLSLGGSAVMIVVLLLMFGLSWFYGIFFETRYNGRTPGKMLFKLRVISTDGRPINGTQATLRNLLRLADMCLLLPLAVLGSEMPMAFMIPTLLVGFVVMTISPRMERLGDLAAGTMVVSEANRRGLQNLYPEDSRAYGLADLIPATFSASSSLAQTIGLYIENRRRLSPPRRQDIAKHLSQPLIHQFGLLPDTSHDLLLCALYVRIFLSAEQQEAGRQQLRQQTAPPPPYSPYNTANSGSGVLSGPLTAMLVDESESASSTSKSSRPDDGH